MIDLGPPVGRVVPDELAKEDMIEGAMEHEDIIHQVEASTDDVILIPESLVHSTTRIKSDCERVILVSRLHTSDVAGVARQRSEPSVSQDFA